MPAFISKGLLSLATKKAIVPGYKNLLGVVIQWKIAKVTILRQKQANQIAETILALLR